MSTAELDAVETLLARVLADPGCFVERLLEQLMGRYTDPGGVPNAALDESTAPSPVWDVPSDSIGRPLGDRDVGTSNDSTLLVAAALGACDCWGTDPSCLVCHGEGVSGWTWPDVELFQEYVGPAAAKLPAPNAGAARDEIPAPMVGEESDSWTQGVSR